MVYIIVFTSARGYLCLFQILSATFLSVKVYIIAYMELDLSLTDFQTFLFFCRVLRLPAFSDVPLICLLSLALLS